MFPASRRLLALRLPPWRWRRILPGALFLAAGWGAPLLGHDPGLSTAQGEWRGGGLALTTGFAPADVESLLPAEAPRSEKWGPEEFEAVRSHLVRLAPTLWEVRAGETLLPQRDVRVELLPEDNVSFHLLVVPGPEVDRLTLTARKIPVLPSAHRQFVVIMDEHGSTLARKLLSARDHVIEVPLRTADGSAAPVAGTAPAAENAPANAPATEPDLPGALAFVWLGIEHIWLGYDHLLFLFALLVVCQTFRSIVAIITCFTLAHSLTLALATLELVQVPARWVEPLIAASIVFVGLENLLRRGREPPGRWALTFAFGLIHGFGFASVLRNLGVGGGGGGIAMPLFSFNLGVELGQIAIAVLVLPIVWHLRRNEKFTTRGVPALSVGIALMGLYWLLERTIL